MGRERKPCHLCGRTVALRNPINRKWHLPHKCPHGKVCASGTLMGAHTNFPAYCGECAVLLRERLQARHN
jgi:ribosomal protein S27AE